MLLAVVWEVLVDECDSVTQRDRMMSGVVHGLRNVMLQANQEAAEISVNIPINLLRQTLLPWVHDARGRCVAPIPALWPG